MVDQTNEHQATPTIPEVLWSGEFGDAYTRRNNAASNGRRSFWQSVLQGFEIDSILEVGCNRGGNLFWIDQLLPKARIVGVDLNQTALEALKASVPRVFAEQVSSVSLPFSDQEFDLAFTAGVLIHHHPNILERAMAEIYRCSRRYVLCAEYFSEEPVEIPYRGLLGALWKRDFGLLYQEMFPDLKLLQKGFLPRTDESTWDDVTFWLFEKPKRSGK